MTMHLPVPSERHQWWSMHPGYTCAVLFYDRFSGWTQVYLMHRKTELLSSTTLRTSYAIPARRPYLPPVTAKNPQLLRPSALSVACTVTLIRSIVRAISSTALRRWRCSHPTLSLSYRSVPTCPSGLWLLSHAERDCGFDAGHGDVSNAFQRTRSRKPAWSYPPSGEPNRDPDTGEPLKLGGFS